MKMYMQALHHKLDVVLVQILPYNCSETDYTFARIRPQQDSALYPDVHGFRPQTPLAFTIFFRSAAPDDHYPI